MICGSALSRLEFLSMKVRSKCNTVNEICNRVSWLQNESDWRQGFYQSQTDHYSCGTAHGFNTNFG